MPADWRVGVSFGFETGTGDDEYTSAKIRVDAGRTLRRLSPKATLGFVVSLSATHPSDSVSVPIGYDPLMRPILAEVKWDANVFELVPSVRLEYTVSPRTRLFGDGGLGLAYTASRAILPASLPAAASSGLTGDGAAAMVRLAGGLLFTPRPDLSLGFEILALSLRFGEGAGSAFGMVASISHPL